MNNTKLLVCIIGCSHIIRWYQR